MHPALRPPPAARRARTAARAAAAAAALALPAGAAAQPVLGPGDDAFVLPAGDARVSVGGAFATLERVYGPGGVLEPFGRRLGADSLGARQLPDVGRAQRALAALTGRVAPAVSLGRLVVDGDARRTTVPLVAEVGVLPRVMLSVTVPIVRTRTEVGRVLNPGGADGNLGPNPATSGAGTAAARAANQLLATQLAGARTRLQQLLATCPAAGGPAECAPVNADRAGATALVERAGAFRASAVALYGDGSDASAGLAYVPLVGSEVARAVQENVAALSGAFGQFGVTQLAAGTLPASSTVRLGAAGVGVIGVDAEGGFGLDSLQGATRLNVGDVEAVASVLLLDGFARDTARAAPRGVRARVSVGAGWRLGTGEPTWLQFRLPYALPTGTGASALLLRGAADVAVGRHAWASVVARYARPLEQSLTLRIPDAPGETLLAAYREAPVTRTVGRTVELEVTPRWALNRALALAGQYVYRSRAADEYAGTLAVTEAESGFGAATLDAAVLGRETAAREQRAGFGLSYSSVDAWRRGQTRLPVDVTYLRSVTLDATGGFTPRATTDELRVRVWLRLFGR